MSEIIADVYYLTLPTDSADQSSSLANYLRAHGLNAEDRIDEVVCPIPDSDVDGDLPVYRQLHLSWKRFWQHSDSELYGLPVYVKPSTVECHQGCPTS